MNYGLILWIALAGAAGSVLRFLISKAGDGRWWEFPLGTLLVNVLGSMLAATVFFLAQEKRSLSPLCETVILIGFLGGFTTFSSYTLQTLQLGSSAPLRAWLYAILSPALALSAAALTLKLLRLLTRQPL